MLPMRPRLQTKVRSRRFRTPTRTGKRTLHVFNGGAAARAYCQNGGDGDVLVWREALVMGRTPNTRRLGQWIGSRADTLARSFSLERRRCERQLRRQERVLARVSRYDEVVIWVGRDLFCQVAMLYLLARVCAYGEGQTVVSLVCPPTTGRGRVPCLGSMKGSKLVAQLEQRRALTPVELRLAQDAWRVYCSPNPRDIDRVMESDLISILEIDRTLTLHRQRFPSVDNGLGRLEQRILEIVSDGHSEFRMILSELSAREPAYGWGDSQLQMELDRLASGRSPALRTDGRIELTDTGRRVITCDVDYVEKNGIDLWLGGAHLDEVHCWRWDQQRHRLI